MKKGCLVSIIVIILILVIIAGGAFYLLRTSKDVGVKWTEKDYQSYREKVKAGNEEPGRFNLITMTDGKFTSNGKKNMEQTFTSAEISSVLSKENNKFGPIRDIKVNFLGNNEGEATFVLTDGIYQYVNTSGDAVSKYPFLKNGLVNIPVYLKAKVNATSPNTISADLQNLSIGRISLPAELVKRVESGAVQVVNKMIKNYNNLSIEQLKFNKDAMCFKGTIPSEITAKP